MSDVSLNDMQFQGVAKVLDNILKEVINRKYPYSPGYNNSSPGRVRGSSKKSASGNFIRNSEIIYNSKSGQIEMYLPEYWRIIDEGVPSKGMKTVERISKNGNSYTIEVPEWMPPVSQIKKWATLKGIDLGKNQGGAFGIAYNIGKFGIKGIGFYDETIMKLESILDDEVADALLPTIEDVIENLLEISFEVKE